MARQIDDRQTDDRRGREFRELSYPVLGPFVPQLAVELGAKPVPSWTSVDGSMLSADISGFTALSEKLAGKGKAGAEEITGLINTCFTALIESAYRYGGEVLKFGGDALLILFRGENHERRCADAGLLMQRALHSSPAAKRANLTMTVGAAVGPFDVFLVGSGYRELLVTGPRATEVIRLEGEAAKGDTLIDPVIAGLLPDAMKLREEHGGWVVTGSTGDAPTGPTTRDHDASDLTPYVPAAVVEQLEAFSELGGEHRLVTVGFTMVVGVAEQLDLVGPNGVAEALGTLVDDVVAACDAYGVTVLHTDIAPDGTKFVLCAGAPVSPGDTTEALLQAMLAITESTVPFVIRQGVQAGRVFAGFLGSPYRRAYTLMGDPVNTAARMLGKADDRDIVAVTSAVEDTRTIFDVEQLEPFLVKGKSEPITASKVRGATGNVRRDTAGTRLVGRERELDILTRAIGELDTVVELVGLAGVGKSRLLDAAWSAAEGLTIYQGACTPYGAAWPYSVFRPLMRWGSGIPVDASAELTGNRLTDIVAEYAPDLVPMLPLLALPFGAKVSPTPEVDAIDPEFRRLRIHEVVVQLLDATLTGPILLVVEDTHWIDDASGELLNHLVQASHGRPWASIITRRPEGEWAIPEADHVVSIELEPLDDDAIKQLAVEVSTRALADRDLDLIAERAQGNPLFAVELARALSESAGDAELPDTIEQIIASRFDRLDPSARRLIRVASVLGNQFHEVIVSAMLTEMYSDADIDAAFTSATAAGAITRRPGLRWAFNHALYRDTAYQGLPFNRRLHLHRLAAETIEQRAADTAAVAPVLSLHYSAARDHKKAWKYSIDAGVIAVAQNATSEAATAYERALASGRYCSSVDATERAVVAERLGDLYYLLGMFDEAASTYRRARRGFDEIESQARSMRKLANVFERQGTPSRAIRWYRRAASSVSHGHGSTAWGIERAQAALGEAAVRSRQGDNQVALELARSALADAEAASDRSTTALALERIHLALLSLREPDIDRAGPRAVEAHREAGNFAGMARALTNLGVEAYFVSNWREASDYYLEALSAAQRAGTVVPAATAAINSAEILSDQGHWQQAIALFDDATRNYAAVGYEPGVAAANLFAGVAAMRDGQLDLAATKFDESRQLLDRLGMTEWVDDLDSRHLELDLLSGRSRLADCEGLIERFGAGHPFRIRVLRAAGLAASQHEQHDTAESFLRLALDESEPGFERALTLLALQLAVPRSPEVGQWQEAARGVLTELSVDQSPPLVPAQLTRRLSPVPSARPQAPH